MLGRASALLILVFFASGCFSSSSGFQYIPERTHYTVFEDVFEVETRHVKHVREARWGAHLAGFRLKKIRVREIFDEALEGNANYYVTDLDIHTEDHATTYLTWILGFLFLPKATVEFDVVEVLPATPEAVP